MIYVYVQPIHAVAGKHMCITTLHFLKSKWEAPKAVKKKKKQTA